MTPVRPFMLTKEVVVHCYTPFPETEFTVTDGERSGNCGSYYGMYLL